MCAKKNLHAKDLYFGNIKLSPNFTINFGNTSVQHLFDTRVHILIVEAVKFFFSFGITKYNPSIASKESETVQKNVKKKAKLTTEAQHIHFYLEKKTTMTKKT